MARTSEEVIQAVGCQKYHTDAGWSYSKLFGSLGGRSKVFSSRGRLHFFAMSGHRPKRCPSVHWDGNSQIVEGSHLQWNNMFFCDWVTFSYPTLATRCHSLTVGWYDWYLKKVNVLETSTCIYTLYTYTSTVGFWCIWSGPKLCHEILIVGPLADFQVQRSLNEWVNIFP